MTDKIILAIDFSPYLWKPLAPQCPQGKGYRTAPVKICFLEN